MAHAAQNVPLLSFVPEWYNPAREVPISHCGGPGGRADGGGAPGLLPSALGGGGGGAHMMMVPSTSTDSLMSLCGSTMAPLR